MVKLRWGLRERLRDALIRPFLISNATVGEVSWGASMGILTALLPLFGIQLYVVLGLWMLARWAFGVTFNLPVCFATSWVMNPLTVVPLYYLYYLTGDALWDALTVPTPDWSFAQFEAVFVAAVSPGTGVWWERLFGGAIVLFSYFGWHIVLGSVLWAVPLSVAAHLTTRWSVSRYRRHRAATADAPIQDAANGPGKERGDPTMESA
jgi:hypothetical protein